MKTDFNFKWKPRQIITCFVAVFGMGFFLSFLVLCDLGTDPATFMNLSASRAVGLSLGNWQLIINIVMLVVVLIFKRSLIGFGTIFNMVLIGYYVDFFDWIWGMLLPADTFTTPISRWAIFFVTLFGFIISAAVYINSDMGVAPYDGIPILIGEKVAGEKKLLAMTVRILWDAAAIGVGIIAGGVPVIGVILMAIFLGPAISLVGKLMRKNR